MLKGSVKNMVLDTEKYTDSLKEIPPCQYIINYFCINRFLSLFGHMAFSFGSVSHPSNSAFSEQSSRDIVDAP